MIGVFDSGIGGLSILQALRAELPQENFMYLADSGHAPYGERSPAYVVERSHAMLGYLLSKNCQIVVIACNTATAAAIDDLRAHHPNLPIIGVEPALKPAVAASRTKRVGVMATRGTLASARFQRLQGALSEQAQWVVQACDGLASAIERSIATDSPSQNATEIIALCKENTKAMGAFGTSPGEIDTLVLGCTHYAFARPVLQQMLGSSIQIIDTGPAVARQTRLRLHALAQSIGPAQPSAQDTNSSHGRVEFFTTGTPATLQAAAGHWLQIQTTVQLLPT